MIQGIPLGEQLFSPTAEVASVILNLPHEKECY